MDVRPSEGLQCIAGSDLVTVVVEQLQVQYEDFRQAGQGELLVARTELPVDRVAAVALELSVGEHWTAGEYHINIKTITALAAAVRMLYPVIAVRTELVRRIRS